MEQTAINNKCCICQQTDNPMMFLCPTTMNGIGKWYCQNHFPASTPPPSGFQPCEKCGAEHAKTHLRKICDKCFPFDTPPPSGTGEDAIPDICKTCPCYPNDCHDIYTDCEHEKMISDNFDAIRKERDELQVELTRLRAAREAATTLVFALRQAEPILDLQNVGSGAKFRLFERVGAVEQALKGGEGECDK